MNDPNQSYAMHECPIALQGVLFPITPPIQSNHPKLLSIWLQVCIVFKRGLHGGSTPVIALTGASCSPTLRSSPLSVMYFNVYMYMHFDQLWATPSGLLPWDSHQTMTSVLVWDTGQPNGDQHHPLVPVGSAATCLAAAVACPHYGPNTTTIISMGVGGTVTQPVRAITRRWQIYTIIK